MKTRRFATGALVAFWLCVLSFAADVGANFSGTWVLDKEKSDPIQMGRRQRGAPGGGAPANIDVTLVIEHTDNNLKIVRKMKVNDQERTSEQKFTLDGQENVNLGLMGRGELKSKSQWKKDKLLIEGVQVVQDREFGIREEYSLSEDGKVLTMRSTRATPRGENTSKQVYNKQ